MRLTRVLPCSLVVALFACEGAPPAAPPRGPVVAPSAPPPSASASATPVVKKLPYPAVDVRPTTTTYFGTEVTAGYQWLEDSSNPAVQKLTEAQNALTRTVLDGLRGRPAIEARVRELLGKKGGRVSELTKAGKAWLVLVEEPPKQQPFLVLRTSLDASAKVSTVLDPNVLDPSGGTTIDWFVPSRDGKLVAVSLSKGGSESGDVHVFEVATGKERKGDTIERVHGGTAGGSLAWNAQGTAFFYTRYPRKGERAEADMGFYQQVYEHRLGAPPSADKYSIGKEFPRIAEVELETSDDGKKVLARVANGDGGEVEHHVYDGKAWTRLSTFKNKWGQATFGKDGKLYVVSRDKAPRGQVLRIPNLADELSTEYFVPESDGVVEQLVVTGDTAYLVDLVGGPSRIRAVSTTKKGDTKVLPLPPVVSVERILRDGDDVVFESQSYTSPPAYFRYDAKAGTVTKTALAEKETIDFSDTEVLRTTCTSKDGTKVPLNVLRKKGTPLDGKRPTLLTGYGGYNVSRKPRLRALTRLWLDRGGVFAEANLRGGGEYGEAWHMAGNLTKKQNVFDDFHACAETLVSEGYTRHDKLAAMGGSNGGLLMGATLVQHPDTFRAIVSRVGIYDMLRVELTPNGAFNVPEYGTVKDEAQFRALYAYSPLHNVKDGVAYPAVLFTTGANDPRVDPYHSRKMVARLQAATSSDKPILLRASAGTGHGKGTPLDAEIAESADIYAFLLHELGEE